jgi:hypothetical protein
MHIPHYSFAFRSVIYSLLFLWRLLISDNHPQPHIFPIYVYAFIIFLRQIYLKKPIAGNGNNHNKDRAREGKKKRWFKRTEQKDYYLINKIMVLLCTMTRFEVSLFRWKWWDGIIFIFKWNKRWIAINQSRFSFC